MHECHWHLCSKALTGRQTKFCSKLCCVKFHVTARRRTVKELLVTELGGKCSVCGYDRCMGALHFHHKDNNKEFAISTGNTPAYATLLVEARKCVLLCANCHAEQHSRRSL